MNLVILALPTGLTILVLIEIGNTVTEILANVALIPTP
jgi:hypothetical protein